MRGNKKYVYITEILWPCYRKRWQIAAVFRKLMLPTMAPVRSLAFFLFCLTVLLKIWLFSLVEWAKCLASLFYSGTTLLYSVSYTHLYRYATLLPIYTILSFKCYVMYQLRYYLLRNGSNLTYLWFCHYN